eukprot:500819_1
MYRGLHIIPLGIYLCCFNVATMTKRAMVDIQKCKAKYESQKPSPNKKKKKKRLKRHAKKAILFKTLPIDDEIRAVLSKYRPLFQIIVNRYRGKAPASSTKVHSFDDMNKMKDTLSLAEFTK